MAKRISFARLKRTYEMPNFIEVQRKSYEHFLQKGIARTRRKKVGLEEVFQETFPIISSDGNYRLEYLGYTIGESKYSVEDCKRQSLTFGAILKIKVRLVSEEGNKESREQEVYVCDLPLMTDTGTFIINGDERVCVSQLHRSPGVSFELNLHTTGKRLYSARIIPYRGAWIEFEFDANDLLNVFIDRRRRFLATLFLRATGLSSDREIIKAFSKITKHSIKDSKTHAELLGKHLAEDVKDAVTDDVIAKRVEPLTGEILRDLKQAGINTVEVIDEDIEDILLTLEKDKAQTREEALVEIYKKLRPGDPPTLETAEKLCHSLFMDPRRYDLGPTGRSILNRKLGMKKDLEERILDVETAVNAIKHLVDLKNADGNPDDIDHLGNRRVRSVGELLQNQIRVGLARMERSSRERMNVYELEDTMPHNLLNTKLIASVIKDFFGRSQLSQFMDQTNPLSELTHKRRLSALGPGGLNRERAGFEVRDVHYSHYGRLCPIETPEGPNIGLISSLSTYARVNDFGFIETPYRKVENKKVTNKIDYLSADEEDQFIIAQANARLNESNVFIEDKVFCRYKNDFLKIDADKIQYMDVSPVQLVSCAAGLIPFLEHDDANRALMGSNMQRQAVPLLFPDSPIVGTGLEEKTAADSGQVIVAEADGLVTYTDANLITVGSRKYDLKKFRRTNNTTCFNQRPIVKAGDKVKAGQIIADGGATQNGELALGRNVLVGFMPWQGYNYEDAILISERLLKDDVYTSLHIDEFEIEARDTRLGPEEVTCDIPNVGEDALSDLDKSGIVRIGAEVTPGDILVGKITPKSETELSPEEKLLRAIFGEKAGDVKDSSLIVPPGVEGVVVDTKIFARKDSRSKTKEQRKVENAEIARLKAEYQERIDSLEHDKMKKLHKLLDGKKLTASLLDFETDKVVIPAGKKIGKKDLKNLERCLLDDIKVNEASVEKDVKKICHLIDGQIDELTYELDKEIDCIKRGDDLPPGVLKRVTVYVASKKKISVGDKMAGRHGNKGVIAKILPEEDMPFTESGEPVDIVLNPLGVPSRMNVGQILETHLGWAGQVLGLKFATPVFDGARETDIHEMMKKANLDLTGKVALFDGRTGEKFKQNVTVGYIYMLKLSHLVDDKIHARSIGPYSLVTQQPLGGKAQFGGQRFGEMEVWALEAYGAAYTLQELLTVKSDDVTGRTKIYESIVKGENQLQPGMPESFNVLVKELQSLGLNITMHHEADEKNAKAKKNGDLSNAKTKKEKVS